MAVKDIYTRKTIIPTSESIGTSRDSEAVRKIQQARGQQEQYKHYERQAIPIKERTLTTIKNTIAQKETQIANKEQQIKNKQENKRAERDSEYRRRLEDDMDELRDEIRAIQKAVGILKTELDKYEKITDPLEIVGYGDKYSQEVLRYSSDVERYEERSSRNSRERQRQERENMMRVEKEVKDKGGFISGGIAFNKDGSIMGILNKQGEKEYETLMKEKSRLDKTPITVEGKGLFIDGKFYPSTNKEWMENKIKEIDAKKYEINIGENKILPLPPEDIPITSMPTITKTTPLGYMREQNKTMEMITTGKPGTTDITTTSIRDMTPVELKKNEEFRELSKLSLNDLLLLSTKKPTATELIWKGRSYDNEIRNEVISMKYQEKLEKIYNEKVTNPVNIYSKQYEEKSNNIISLYELGQITKEEADIRLDKYYKEYEDATKIKEDEFKSFAEQDAKQMTGIIHDSNVADMIARTATLGKVGLAVGTGFVAGLAGGGVFGTVVSTAVKSKVALGIGLAGLGISATSTGMTIYKLKTEGLLTKERVVAILAPQIILIGASIAGGAVGGSYAFTRYQKVRTEFLMNVKSQKVLYDTKFQNKIFTKANINRGYAEIEYRGYNMNLEELI